MGNLVRVQAEWPMAWLCRRTAIQVCRGRLLVPGKNVSPRYFFGDGNPPKRLVALLKVWETAKADHHVTYVSITRGWKLTQRRGDASRRITDSEDALPVPVAWTRAWMIACTH